MDAKPTCPVCDSNAWEVISKRRYEKAVTSHLSQYAKIRYEVLFDVWLPGKVEVELYSILCKKCGFVVYRPRPSEVDINNKYEYLTDHPVAKKEYTAILPSDRKRSQELYKFVRRYLSEQATVLDFGGGNGRLMSRFLQNGHSCEVVDYVEETLPGVKLAGRTLSDIPNGKRYDFTICSHVLEHLANPRKLVKELSSYVTADGALFFEVPSEIWRSAPLAEEPVTHVNFFTADSLRTLLEIAGLDVPVCKYQTYTSTIGGAALAIRAIGKLPRPNEKPQVSFSGIHEVKRLLNASRTDDLLRALRHPRLIRGVIRRAGRRIPFFWRYF